MKKSITILVILIIAVCELQAQSIKQQAEKRKQQQQYEQKERERELKEEARIKKAQLNFNDLIQLLRSKDLEYVDQYLSKRGWKLSSTDIGGIDDYEEDMPTYYKTVIWALDEHDDLAKGWFHFYLYVYSDNAIAYSFANEEQLDLLKSELISNGYRRSQATDVITRGLESVYRNSLYEVNFRKQLKKQGERGADIGYVFFIYNYKENEERLAEIERLAREEAEKEEKYQRAIKRADNAYYQKQYAVAKQAYSEALSIRPENFEILLPEIANAEINNLCPDFDTFKISIL